MPRSACAIHGAVCMLSEQLQQFVATPVHHLLIRRKLQHHFAAQSLRPAHSPASSSTTPTATSLPASRREFPSTNVQNVPRSASPAAQLLECSAAASLSGFEHGFGNSSPILPATWGPYRHPPLCSPPRSASRPSVMDRCPPLVFIGMFS